MPDKLAQIARAAQALEKAREQLETEIIEALEEGIPLRQVAKAANLSRPTIYSIRDRKAGNEK